jgi:hypothetical protein
MKLQEPSVACVLEKFLDTKKSEHPLDKFFLSLADEAKNVPLQLQLRVKQEVLQAVLKAQLDALLCGLAGTSGLSAGSFYKAGICSEFTEQYSESSSSYQQMRLRAYFQVMIILVIVYCNVFYYKLLCLNQELLTYS